MIKKLFVSIVILLFLGVVVAQSINLTVVKASDDNNLVKVTTQACGIKGYGNTAVKLTREQYQNLELYLVEFRARLNQTSTREEAVPIFMEAVVVLDKYGLLPRGMSVGRTQRLITGWNQNHNQRILNRQQKIFPNCANVFCFLFGSVEGQSPYPPNILPFLLDIGPSYIFIIPFAILLSKLGAENLAVGLMRFFIGTNTLKFLNIIWINTHSVLSVDLHSVGLKGIGNSDYPPSLVLGYTGLLLRPSIDKAFLFGSALAVI